MEWKKGWLLKDAIPCPLCNELVYPWEGYVCRGFTVDTVKERRKPNVYGSRIKIKKHDIYLFYHIHCHEQTTEEQRYQHFSEEAKRRGLK